MTIEKAISTIKTARADYEWTYPYQDTTAFDMAIKALEQTNTLDKIRAEIEQLRLHKAEFLTNDNKVCIDSQAVLDLIDKYRVEDEGEEWQIWNW